MRNCWTVPLISPSKISKLSTVRQGGCNPSRQRVGRAGYPGLDGHLERGDCFQGCGGEVACDNTAYIAPDTPEIVDLGNAWKLKKNERDISGTRNSERGDSGADAAGSSTDAETSRAIRRRAAVYIHSDDDFPGGAGGSCFMGDGWRDSAIRNHLYGL